MRSKKKINVLKKHSGKKCLSNNNVKRFHLKKGEKAPRVKLQCRKRDNKVKGPNKFCWNEVSTKDLYENRRIIIFGLPGAFTPTCSNTHLPGYEKRYDEIRRLGIDEIYCLSVNDAFVMFNWCKKLKVKKVQILPDGNGSFTKKMGLLVEKNNLGFGRRSWRYAMVVNDGVIEALFEEPGKCDNLTSDPYGESSPESMLKYLTN